MATLDVVRRISIEAQERGVSELSAKLARLEKQYEGVAQAGVSTEKATVSVERAFNRELRAVDQVSRAYSDFARSAKAFADARAQGLIGEARHAELLQSAEARLRRVAVANDNFAKSTQHVAGNAQLARYELINFGRQVQDVGVSLASGQAPLTVLIQQGSQIADIFATSGISLRNFAAQIGPIAARYGTIAAAIGAVAAAVVSANRVLDQGLEARQALGGGRGRFLGATPDQIAGAAQRTAGNGVSLDEAREGILAGVRAGAPSLEVLERANALAQRLATTLKIDLKPAQQELAGVLGDRTTRSFEQIAEKLGIYDKATVNLVRSLQNQGNFTEAAKVQVDAIQQGLVRAADATTAWGRAWAYTTSQIQKGLDVAGRIATFTPPTPDTPAGQRLLEQQQAIQQRPGFATALRGETRRDRPLPLGTDASAEAEAVARLGAAREEELRRQRNITEAIKEATAAQNDQIAVLNARTVAERAAATQTQAYNQLLKEGKAEEEALGLARLRAARVLAESAAEQQKVIANQRLELDMGSKFIAAAQMQGEAGIRVNAALREYLTLQQAGIDVTTAASRARIADAGSLAVQAARIQDAGQAAKILAQGKDQLELIRLETKLINEEAGERARRLEIMRGEIQAREQERSGMTASAEATRKTTREIANANAELERQRDLSQLDRAGQHTARATGLNAEGVLRLREVARQMSGTWRDIANGLHQGADGFNRFVDKFGRVVDDFGRTADEAAAAMSGRVTPGTFGGQSGNQQFTSTTRQGYMMEFMKLVEQNALQRKGSTAANDNLAAIQRDAQQRELSLAQSRISDTISELGDQRSALEDQIQQYRSRIDEQFSAPDRPDPYMSKNPDYFYRFGTTAWKEEQNKLVSPLERLLKEAEAQRDGIDAQIRQLEEQSRQASRLSDLMQAGVSLQTEEVAGIRALIGAVAGLGTALQQSDFSRMLAASQTTTAKAISEATTAAKQTTTAGGFNGIPVMSGVNSFLLPSTSTTSNFAGNFASGGVIPPGMWGLVGEAGPEMVRRPRNVRGPAEVTPINQGITVNQTIISMGSQKQLRESRGEIAQRATADMRRQMAAA